MDTFKIRIKTGEHELEAEGPVDAVHASLATFARIVGIEEKPAETSDAKAEKPGEAPPPAIAQIVEINRRVVSLKKAPESAQDAVLLLLLGQHQLLHNNAVAGREMMQGMRASRYSIDRVDLILKRHASLGNVVATGKRKRLRYRLTKDGVEKAQDIAAMVASSVTQHIPPPATL